MLAAILLALAAQTRTIQLDTGPRACETLDLWPDRLRGRFAYRAPALPIDAHDIEASLVHDGEFTIIYENRGATPLWFTGGVSVRCDQFLGDGSTLWWFGAAQVAFQVTESNPLMPGEKREEHFAYSKPDSIQQAIWDWQEKVKTGLFCCMEPVVCTLNGVEMCCDNPAEHPDLDVYVKSGDAWARLHGEVTYN